MSDEIKGYYSIAYSPDDEVECGRGYYADLWWNRKTSPLYDNAVAADKWARRNGGVKQMPNGAGRTY